jgi:hypothetical protein
LTSQAANDETPQRAAGRAQRLLDLIQSCPRQALIILAFLLVVFSLGEGFWLGIDRSEPSGRLRFHAIPVAISQIYYSWPHDYTANFDVARIFSSYGKTRYAINATTRNEIKIDHTSVYYWTADDRGLADFVYFSFHLFGPRLISIFLFWYLILIVAVAAFVIGTKWNAIALSVLCCGVAGVFAALPVFVRAAGPHVGEPSAHISESRLFEILGAVPALFLIISTALPDLLSSKRWYAAAFVQVSILAFLLHCRSSIAWLFVALIFTALLGTLYRIAHRPDRIASRRILAIPALLVSAWLAVVGYQSAMFNPAYFGELGPRTVWHNVLMGFAYNPGLISALGGSPGSDAQAVQAVLRYMQQTHDPRLRDAWNETTILNSLGGYGRFDWKTYEQVARELALKTLASNPWNALELVMYDKPRAILQSVACKAMLLCSFSQEDTVPKPWARFDPTGGLMLIVVSVIAALLAHATASGGDRDEEADAPFLFAVLGIVCVLSLGPGLIFYPAVTQLGGLFVFGTILLYLGIVHFLAAFLRRHPAFEAPCEDRRRAGR